MILSADCRSHCFPLSLSLAAPPTSPPPQWKRIPGLTTGKRSQSFCGRRPHPTWISNAGRFRFRQQALDDDEIDGGFRSKKKRSWWSDEPSEFDEEYEPLDDESGPLDGLWFVKVLGSYGWMLPAIVISLLLATGPKAFVMALALPLGQSVLSLAFNKLWGATRNATRRKSKARRKPYASAAGANKSKENAKFNGKKRKSGSDSWMATKDDAMEKDVNSTGASFGGWDELDQLGASNNSQAGQSSQLRDGPSQSQPKNKVKLAKGGRYTDMPLLVRLLIAVFPFLGSWTRFL